MKLGTKINIIIASVTIGVLAVVLGIIVAIEAGSIKQETLQESITIGDLLKSDIDRVFQDVYDQQGLLQTMVAKLSSVGGVRYIKVIGADSYLIAATDHNEVGKKVIESDNSFVTQVINEKRGIDVQTDKGTFFDLDQYIPVQLREQDGSSGVIAVVQVGISANSKSANDVLAAKKTLQTISVSIEQGARTIIATRESDLATIQKISDEIKGFAFFNDFVVLNNKLNIIANTSHNKDLFLDDPREYDKYREDVLFGKIKEATYERVSGGKNIYVRVVPVELVVGGTVSTVGLIESHILSSSYKDRLVGLVVRMSLMGIFLTAILISVLTVILRREVVEPIKKYSQIAEKVSAGDLTQRIEPRSDDEIGQFGRAFNAMVLSLSELDRLKTDFITVAAHQLRTPLSSVNWALKLLLDSEVGPINDDQREMLNRGYETNTKMTKLVNDLLDVTSIEHGKFVYKFEMNDFGQVINTLIKNIEFTAQEHNIKINLEKHGEIPLFAFDVDKISIALQNLIDNALKYTLPGGHITIITERRGDYLETKVSDTGMGIPKDDLAKIFSKFFRAANAVHLQTEGSGLGLVIARGIIMHHGGKIGVDSVEGQGTTFTVSLPLLPELLPKDESLVPEGRAATSPGVLG